VGRGRRALLTEARVRFEHLPVEALASDVVRTTPLRADGRRERGRKGQGQVRTRANRRARRARSMSTGIVSMPNRTNVASTVSAAARPAARSGQQTPVAAHQFAAPRAFARPRVRVEHRSPAGYAMSTSRRRRLRPLPPQVLEVALGEEALVEHAATVRRARPPAGAGAARARALSRGRRRGPRDLPPAPPRPEERDLVLSGDHTHCSAVQRTVEERSSATTAPTISCRSPIAA
jgi:hypothetical protein